MAGKVLETRDIRLGHNFYKGLPHCSGTLVDNGAVYVRPTGSNVRLLVLFLGLALILSPAPAPQPFPRELAGELEGVLARYQAAVPMQQRAMLGVDMQVDYEASFPELHEQGRWHVRRMISRLGEVTFKQISAFVGDERVRKELIERTMTEEQNEKAFGAFKVTQADYKFSINAIFTRNSRKIYVYDVTPRRKSPTLFEGQVEIDGETGMPLRETGRLSRNPHWILSNVQFSRDYELRGGIAVVKNFETRATVRLGIGTAHITAHYSDYQPENQPVARERAF